jgi:hypothetical protein
MVRTLPVDPMGGDDETEVCLLSGVRKLDEFGGANLG